MDSLKSGCLPPQHDLAAPTDALEKVSVLGEASRLTGAEKENSFVAHPQVFLPEGPREILDLVRGVLDFTALW